MVAQTEKIVDGGAFIQLNDTFEEDKIEELIKRWSEYRRPRQILLSDPSRMIGFKNAFHPNSDAELSKEFKSSNPNFKQFIKVFKTNRPEVLLYIEESVNKLTNETVLEHAVAIVGSSDGIGVWISDMREL